MVLSPFVFPAFLLTIVREFLFLFPFQKNFLKKNLELQPQLPKTENSLMCFYLPNLIMT